MRILLTGGAGYVGSACLRGLLDRGHQPIAFDNLSRGNAPAVPDGLLEIGDIEDKQSMVAAIRKHGIEAVMHFATVASVPESIRDPEQYWRTNVLGTKNVLNALCETGVKRIVLSSTAAVYGFDARMPVEESGWIAPQTSYGTSKLAAEHLVRDYSKAHGLGYAILRYFNAAGADPDGEFGEHRAEESHLIPLVLRAALGGGRCASSARTGTRRTAPHPRLRSHRGPDARPSTGPGGHRTRPRRYLQRRVQPGDQRVGNTGVLRTGGRQTHPS
jgi:UDP-glucose 4-epimerase